MGIGIWQVVLILLVVVIIFGAGKLPRVMGDVAKGVRNFKSGLKDEDEDDDAAAATAAKPQVSKSDTAGDEKAGDEKNSAAKG